MGGRTMGAVTNNNNEQYPWWYAIIALLAAWAVTSMLFGCKTQYVEVPKVTTKIEHSVDTLHDSIFYQVFSNRYIKGDTVFDTKTEYKYKMLYKSKVDTFIQHDSIPYYITKYKTTSVKIGWFSKLKMWMFFPLLILLAILIVYIIIRR